MSLRLVFCGTPSFALPSFEALLADPDMAVVGVLTQPDRPAGRGQQLTPPPVKHLALERHMDLRQPHRLRQEPDVIAWLESLQPDFLVTAAFGQILNEAVLAIPQYGTVNVHASLLPAYRGPNPVQWALLNGDETAGVTTMLTELGVDTGPILLKAETPIDPNENTLALTARLARLGGDILVDSLKGLADGTLQPIVQEEALATHAPKLKKEAAILDWSQPAITLHNRIRGQQPSPGALSMLNDMPVKFHQSRSPLTWPESEDFMKPGSPGEILAIIKAGLVVQTGSGPLLIEVLQPPGKPKMSAYDWAQGALRNIETPRFVMSGRMEVH